MLSRRSILASFLAASAIRPAAAAVPSIGTPLPTHADLWARLPLPCAPAEAWHRLPAAVQAEIGATVIGMALADYISGDMHDEADRFHDVDLRETAASVRDDLLNRMTQRLWDLMPELYGPEGDHPRWVLAGGFAQ